MATELNNFHFLSLRFQLTNDIQLRSAPSIPNNTQCNLLSTLRTFVLVCSFRQIVHLRTRGETLVDGINTNAVPQAICRMQKTQYPFDSRKICRELKSYLALFLHLHRTAQSRNDELQKSGLIMLAIENQAQMLSCRSLYITNGIDPLRHTYDIFGLSEPGLFS